MRDVLSVPSTRRSSRYRPALALTFAALTGLAACTQNDPAKSPETDSPTPTSSASAAATASPQIDDRLRSEYTALILPDCTVTKRMEEGDSISWACPGYQGERLIVHSGDGRFDIDAGADNGTFETLSAFNEPGEKVEWRIAEDQPFAIIYRLRDVSLDSAGRSVLAVETISRAGAPGCLIAQIAGDIGKVNERARQIADDTARGFDCSANDAQFIGDAR